MISDHKKEKISPDLTARRFGKTEGKAINKKPLPVVREALHEIKPEPESDTPVPNQEPGVDESKVKSWATSDKGKKENNDQQEQLIIIASEADLFKSTEGKPFATIPVAGHHETYPLGLKKFRLWLSQCFYWEQKKVPSPGAIKEVLEILEGKALFGGTTKPVFVRIGQAEEKIFVDLANDSWEVVEISASGFKVIQDAPVRFQRPAGMLPLPLPRIGNGIGLKRFKELIGLVKEPDWVLIISWLIGALNPFGPYAILNLIGEQGSGKSFFSRLLRDLIDPNSADLRSPPNKGIDLMLAAINGWIVAFDNLSKIDTWLSDDLCRLATGGGSSTRMLYKDDQEIIFHAKRPIILNSINTISIRHDLVDRAILINVQPINRRSRKTEAELMAEFEEIRPDVLGDLFMAVAMALKNHGKIKLDTLPRMADFALWVTQAEEALPWEKGEFQKAFKDSRREKIIGILEENPVVDQIRRLMQVHSGNWEGTATELFHFMNPNGRITRNNQMDQSWPKDPGSVSKWLKSSVSFLRVAGIEVQFPTRTASRRSIVITSQGPVNV